MEGAAWKRCLALGSAVAVLVAACPLDVQAPLGQAVRVLLVAVMFLGIRRRRPVGAGAWYLFATGAALVTTGHFVLAASVALTGHDNPFPSPADAFYIAGYVAIIAGEILFLRRRSTDIEGDNFIDALILATCLAVVSWAYVLMPYAEDPSMSLTQKAFSVGYSMLTLALVAMAARLAVGSGRRNPSYYLLAGSLVFIVATDVVATLNTAGGSFERSLTLFSILSYVMVAASILHPSMVSVTDRPGDREIQLTRRRLTMLLAAVLFVPTLLILEAVSGRGSNVPVMAGGSVLLTVLVLARLAGLVRAKDRKAQREQVLREAGSALVTATTTEQIHQGALVALLALIGPGGSTRVSIASGSRETLTVMAADGPAAKPAIGTRVPMTALPTDARDAFLQGRTVVLDRATPPDLPTSVVAEEARVVIVPLSTRSELRGGVFITFDHPLEPEALLSVETLAKQVALALESAALAEEVHQRRQEKRFRALVDHSFTLIMVVSCEGTTRFVSPACMQMLGVPESEMTGSDVLARVHPDDRQRARVMLDRARSEPGVQDSLELRWRHQSGEWRWFEIVAANLLEEPEVAGTVLHARDITDRKEVRLRMEESEARFRSLVQHASDVVIVLDDNLTMTYVSPSVGRVLGHAPEDLMATSWFDLVHPDDAVRARKLTGDTPSQHDVELRVCHRDGTWHTVDLTVSDLRDDVAVRGIVLNGRDVTERHVLEGQLRHQALHDGLSGLANRTLFADRVGHALSRRDGEVGGVVVLFIDLDDFKTVNDSLGHAAGDELLKEVASRLTGALRAGDTAARLGGDEFAMLLEKVTGLETVLEIVMRVQAALRAPFMVAGRAREVTASIGVARDQGISTEADVLLRNADVAMYQAKSKGKNRHELFEAGMQALVRERFELKSDLAKGLEQDQFHLLYQPVVSLASGELCGVEALLRWQHPTQGLVSPEIFIPLAEESGFIVPLGRWVLEQACHQLRRWRDEHDHRAMSMSVNVSVRQLQSPGFSAQVELAIRASGIPAEALTLEITESVLMDDVDIATRRLAELKNLDVVLAVDDFGTGYSSLGYLQGFPVDVVKIDRSFIQPLGRRPQQTDMIRAIIDMARSLNLRTVAEGIEEPEQAEILRMLGCESAQGFHFSRPVTAKAIGALLAEAPAQPVFG
jgi:diguanylate cyclase (GGDEF)-like protein/PAS domain S-box-containing protein